jgi:hypothetical protein
MERKAMTITELKQKQDFYTDAIYQKGYDLGWEAALETLEQVSDSLWNKGETATGQSLRDIINRVRGAHDVA